MCLASTVVTSWFLYTRGNRFELFYCNKYSPPANEVYEGYVFTPVCLSAGRGVVSQHALQVSRGCVYPSMPCRFPGPHPKGSLKGLARGGRGLQAHCTVPFSLLADPERIPRRLYIFTEDPCKSTNTTSEPCSPVFKEAQPRPSSTQFRISHKQLESVSICIWTVIIYCCNKRHPTGL